MITSHMHGLTAMIQSLIALFVGVLRMVWASAIALVLFTAWIMVQGFRILTGQSREPLMGLVVNASRNTLILIAAGTMAVGGSSIQTFFTDTMASGINGMVTGKDDKPA
ncbi:hypothetical protein, partial [Variovorax sp. DXTD-1]|uniref:hypothetical protein n=1 Tax=Variovorax sp. DXTD-1 TaxID=2495592 RepID=UPI000FBC10C2